MTYDFDPDPTLPKHYADREHVDADGWHCTICGGSVDFEDGDPVHDDLSVEPPEEPVR